MKIVIIGGSAGGATVAARLRRLNEKAKIIIIDKNDTISYATCGIPYYIGDVIRDKEKLQVVDTDEFIQIANTKIKTHSQVTAINRQRHTVSIRDLKTNILYEENYDKLVLAPGGQATRPDVEGIHLPQVFAVRNKDDANAIKAYLSKHACVKATIIGAGFIGVEMAENLVNIGVEVAMVEKCHQILRAWDFEFANKIRIHMQNKGVNIFLNNSVVTISPTAVKLTNGEILDTDIVILALGVTPDLSLARAAGLKIGETGGIAVNSGLVTSDENIFALGDAIEIEDVITNLKTLIPLAGHAHKQARVVAENICGRHCSYKPTMGTTIVKVFDYCVAQTGCTEQKLLERGISYKKSYIEAPSRAAFYPDTHSMIIKLLFAGHTGTILGAQIVGVDGVDKRIDVLATAIAHNSSVSKLMDLELAYAPPFSAVKDPVHIAGTVAHNMLHEEYYAVHWDEPEMFDQNHTLLIDVRTPEEFDIRTLDGAINLPLTELRDRAHEITRDKRIIVFCQIGKKGYFASKILHQYGFTEVYNLNGGINIYMLGNPSWCKNCETALTRQKGSAHSPKPRLIEKIVEDEKTPFFDLRDFAAPAIATKPSHATMTKNPMSSSNCVIEVDACGLSCPGPILKLTKTMKAAALGDVIKFTATDSGFATDVKIWCQNKGHKLLEFDNSSSTILAVLQKC